MIIVTHSLSDLKNTFSEIPSFRFRNFRMSRELVTDDKSTIVGQVINRVYVDSLEFPTSLESNHLILFIVEIPFYKAFCSILQSRFSIPKLSVDPLLITHIITWVMNSYNIKTKKAKNLLDYFSYSLLKIVYNPEVVDNFLNGKADGVKYISRTYDTLYKYILGDASVSKEDFLITLSKYRGSTTSIVKWMIKKLNSEDKETLKMLQLKLWLQGKKDIDLIYFGLS